MNVQPKTIILVFVMAAAIFICRAFPFIFFRGVKADIKPATRFLQFIEKTAPPAAMTVLCFNALAAPVKENPDSALPVLSAALLTALLHVWKRNSLLSIMGGTAFFMLLKRLAA